VAPTDATGDPPPIDTDDPNGSMIEWWRTVRELAGLDADLRRRHRRLPLRVASGLAAGISYGVAGGRLNAMPRLLGASLAYAPAMWLMVAVAVALVGLVARGTIAAWAALGFCLIVGLLGRLFHLSRWAKDLSPFEQVPRLPAAAVHPLSLVVLIVITAALCSAGLFGLRRRDIA
jgi:ABC-2 type transport system permease protein